MRTKEKLRTYFIGFGIGLVLSGLMLYARWRWQQANPQPQPAPSPAGLTSPPAP
ncbi:MAG: hypothetical protein AAFX79_13005 [Planctomycetota bacterium]